MDRMRLGAIAIALVICACHARPRTHVAGGVLGRVVIYRNGVAFYERHARLENGRVAVRVPRDRVDDFLKSLTVVDRATGRPLAVAIPRTQDSTGTYLTMTLEATEPGRSGDVLLTYVTEAPAWKPSYRVVVGEAGKVLLEAWAVVDNTTSEDWKGVLVGVGASSAMSFRYDLWSVRRVDRDLLASDDRFAIAPPTGVSPFGEGGEELAAIQADELGVSFSGSTSLENTYYVDGINTTGHSGRSTGKVANQNGGQLEGQVTDAATGEPIPGATVVASGAGGSQHTAVSDGNGRYRIVAPPGSYKLTFYYADITVERTGVKIAASTATAISQPIDLRSSRGEVIAIKDSSRQGIKIDRNYTRHIPLPGRSFDSAMGAAAGAAGDGGAPPRPALSEDQLKTIVAKVTGDGRDVVVEVRGAPGSEAQATARGTAVKHRLVDAGVVAAKIHVVPRLGAGEPETIRVLAVAPRPRTEPAKRTSAGGDSPVGESHFMAERPMTVRAGSSAMVSMVRGETTGGVVYYYDPISERGDARYAFKAVRLDNPTDDTLESGPVTVYGDGRFIGEGITEPVPPRAAAVVPFALDRQIVVERTGAEQDQIAKLVSLQRGVLTAEVQHRRDTRFAITSRLATPAVVYLRHRLADGWALLEHPTSVMRIGDSHLFRVELPAGATTEVTVSEATPVERTFELGSEDTLGMMQIYLSDPRASHELRQQIEQLLATHRSAADLHDRIDTLREQLAEYRSRSGELHAQIVTLKAVRGGGELLATLKHKLAEMSARTQQATIDVVKAQEQLMLARVRFQNQLAELKLTDATQGVTRR
jgi:hypothetical protein